MIQNTVKIDMARFVNQQIAIQLEALAISLSDQEVDKYKAGAYFKAAEAIRRHPEIIVSGAQAQRDIKGVGKTTAERIDQFLMSGSVMLPKRGEAEKPDLEKLAVLKVFTDIHGVNTTTAEKWYRQGYRTLDDLSKLYLKMTPAQQIGFKYYLQLRERIPRVEIDEFQKIFAEVIPHHKFLICGSYRRGHRTSGDIDLLIKGTNFSGDNSRILAGVVGKLVRRGFIIETLSAGENKFMGLARLSSAHNARRLDILVSKPQFWPAATLYFTGSKELNIQMRKTAKSKDLILNEYGLREYEDGGYISVNSEKEIFDYLEIAYLSPENRDI